MKDLYISTDIEADGPIPGEYSMLSLGAVAIDSTGKIWGEFYRKLKRLPKAKQHPETMKWWKNNISSYKEATSNQENPKKVMQDYVTWLKEIKEKTKAEELVFYSSPLCYDYMFVYWYMVKFVNSFKSEQIFKIPFAYNGVDFTSYAMGKKNLTYTDALTKNLPQSWFENLEKNSHKSIDDARRQGLILVNMLKDNRV